jgi:hypothetical protein
MESENALLYSEEPAIGTYLEPDERSLRPQTLLT